MTLLFLDFETRSRIDLRKVGAYRYAEDPSTEATLASWAIDDGEVHEWRAANAGAGAEWMPAARDPGVTIVAHNAEFEKQILLRRFGIDVPASRMRCTAARAARCGLPRKLGQACAALGLAEQKDARGERLVHKFSKPRPLSIKQLTGERPAPPDEYWTEETAPEDWDDFEEYNGQDSRAMRELHRVLPDLSLSEQRAWEMTVRMNERGLAVDLAAIPLAAEAARVAGEDLAGRFEALTGCKPFSPKARAALGMERLDKAHVRHALRRPDLPAAHREALEIRKRVAKASVKKLAALERRVSLDGRLRGALTYAGAERTQRWSGGGVQLHNLPRGLGEATDLAFDALGAGALDLLYDPILAASEMLKGFFTGPFLIGDFAQVECRTEAWLARQLDLVDAFRSGADIYCAMASDIYGYPVSKKDFDENLRIAKRQLGKVAILGCGYGLGAKKFRKQLDEVFDVVIDEDLAVRVVETYRARYPRIPAFWRLLERGFAHVVRNGSRRVQVGPVFMGTAEHGGRPFAYIELPSGRPLWYAFPKLALSDPALPPCERQYLGEDSISYLGRDLHRGGQWGRVTTYGGKLTENVVQATSRDLLLDAMVRLEDAGFPLSLTVHDEVVAEESTGLEDFARIMNAVPPWAAGLPHAAECFATRRYRK